ncbi:cell division protein ZapE [Oceanimonas baumannii]|uniref:Cell division protein ZapE n=1 Tax=Oceanimonas baumannii TaxID=129578 RepID=A0A235CMQ1_9GAMM|nr:cell division protein ZapE [Oceanimonas baumannii]OYD25716.1 cell division protein ZapE [Oceanimonas baumannii]TDW60283.1 cell division protein ZapE [Oceanimonas baumannii]
MTVLSPHSAYLAALESGFTDDDAQRHAIEWLECCYRSLLANEAVVQGVYLWGPVGRGKTWLMDRFFYSLQSAGVSARRLHFHHFMQQLHRRLFQLTGTEDPLKQLAQELSSEIRVLCLDELFVSDIGDAMLLGRLLQHLFEQGLVLVATSNQHPEGLYESGFNREQFLPAVASMIRHMRVVAVHGREDHRLHPGLQHQRYWINDPGALAGVFGQLAGAGKETTQFMLGNRLIPLLGCSEQVLWCRYADLCEQPLAAQDFIVLCDRFDYILLSEVPRISCSSRQVPIARGTEDGSTQVAAGDRMLPVLSRQDDGGRRFIALVDECYDRGIPLYIEAAVPMDELYTDGALAFAFRRTLSRLKEMQLARFKGRG